MKKIMILIGLLTLNFMPVRCINNEQQEKLYSLDKYSWGQCNATGEKRKELMENMFLLTYEEANEILKTHYAIKVAVGCAVAVLLTGIVLLGFTIFGLVNSFSYRFNSKNIDTVGCLCKILSVALLFEFLLGDFALKYFNEKQDEIRELLYGKNMEKAKIRSAYIREKILNDVDFDIYEYMFNNENK